MSEQEEQKREEPEDDGPQDRFGCGYYYPPCHVCCGQSNPEPQYHYLEPRTELCCFEIMMNRVKFLENKDGAAQVILAGYANQHEAVFPGLGAWLHVGKNWDWVNINKRIGEFYVKRGEVLGVLLRADAIEAGRALEGNFELGSNEKPSVNMTLSCGIGSAITKRLEVECHRPKLGGKVRAKFLVEFLAFEKSCCC